METIPRYSDLRGNLVTIADIVLAAAQGKGRHRSTQDPTSALISLTTFATAVGTQEGLNRGNRGRGVRVAAGGRFGVGR